MTVPVCSQHHVAMEIVPAEPQARCLSCGYVTRHLQFEHCRECGSRMHIEEPEPHWRCSVLPSCARAAGSTREVSGLRCEVYR